MKSKGFTLIELAVVLAIIAILAAVLTPLVTQYVDEARVNRAMAEARLIAQGVNLHLRDTGKYPIYASYTATTTDSEALYGPGTAPTLTGWGAIVTTSLQTRLNTNVFNLPTTVGTGRVNYRGPYTGGIEADPWGSSYIAFVGPGTNSAALFVISAGPDGVVSTVKYQSPATFSAAGDDVVVRIK